jgi:hypothetical protein
MARTRSAENRLRWGEILKRQADSGLSIRAFCASEAVSEASFYAWRRKLRQRQTKDRQPLSARRREDASEFVPVTLLDATPTLEIFHPLGYRIQVSGEVNPVALRQVIEALDQRDAP